MVIEKSQEIQDYRTEDMNMEKYKFDDRNGLWYELQGDYYLPCLKLPEEEQAYIGIWGQRHLRYLKKHHRVLYGNLLTSGKLNSYLAGIDQQAEEIFERLVKQMAKREGVTEQLKAANSMEWVRKMNSIRGRAVEITNGELIYAQIERTAYLVARSKQLAPPQGKMNKG